MQRILKAILVSLLVLFVLPTVAHASGFKGIVSVDS
jgi:hypothetical protein